MHIIQIMGFRRILRNLILKILEEEPKEKLKKEVKKEPKVSVWVSRDKEIDDRKIREKEAEERELPHPIE